ncbi:hypothetical protein PIROE2DRAFT_67223 [Piromyces sp. E2]|nr:hypothetical protein PIROE2DRAFT_67223 [Piromyces sp. E2]|eukprot:OUM65300.1 hypothetical protein PIROE2DRAFT_67223 [Piromyces sp. E2]
MTKPLTPVGSPNVTKQVVNKNINEENNESEEKNNETESIRKDEIKKSDFVNFFTNAVSSATESINKTIDDQVTSSPSTLITNANEIEDSSNRRTDSEEVKNKTETESHINEYEKSQAYIELESQCNQFKSVVDNLISKLLSLQKENDILLNEKKELLNLKNQSQQEIEELKLENTLLKNELKIKNSSSTTGTTATNNNNALKENIQNENSYMINNF